MSFARLRKFYVLKCFCIITVFVSKRVACYSISDMEDSNSTVSETEEIIFSETPNLYGCQFTNEKASSAEFEDSLPEVVWVTSQSVFLQRNFQCLASECVIDCGVGAESTNNEKWNCTLRATGSRRSGRTQVSIFGTGIPTKLSRSCLIQLKEGDAVYSAGHFEVTTRDGRPAKPGPLVYWNVTRNGFVVSWVPSPHTDVDPVDYYVLTILHDKPNYHHDPLCPFPEKGTQDFRSSIPKPFTLSNLLPYFVYKVWVTAYNSFGSQQGDIVTIITKPAEPEECQNVSIQKLHSEDASIENEPVYLFKWSEPCRWNGLPQGTRLVIVGSRPDNILKKFRYEKTFSDSKNEFRFNLPRDFNYSVELWAGLEGNVQALCAPTRRIHEPPGLSSVTNKLWSSIRPEVLNCDSDDGGASMAKIPLSGDLLNDSNGTIRHLAIMVAENGQEGTRERKFLPLPEWPEERNWAGAVSGEHVLLYQATPKYWNVTFEDNVTYWFELGSEKCGKDEYSNNPEDTSSSREKDSLEGWRLLQSQNVSSTVTSSSASEDNFYCNGRLRRNKLYVVRLRVFTAAGYSDSDEMHFKTDDAKNGRFKAFFLGLLLFITVAAFLIRRKRIPRIVVSPSIPRNTQPSLQEHPHRRSRSIPPQKFPEVAENLLTHMKDLEIEFKELNNISNKWSAKVACSVGRMRDNRVKNRYADVLPYDYNRVKLSTESTNQTDYINASFVKGFSFNTEYIACQGPKRETSNDFWQMVFDQNVSFIVMLTALIENGAVKCSQYFAEPSEDKDWDGYIVKCCTRLDLVTYTIRELEVYKKANKDCSCPEKHFPEKRSIQHFHFRDWPDFGPPRTVDGILEFCDVFRRNVCLGGDTKVVVHCSAGIGRTGTFIALDILLQYIHNNRNMDIMQTVLRLREQRQCMVSTLKQYVFLYQCLRTASESYFSTAN